MRKHTPARNLTALTTWLGTYTIRGFDPDELGQIVEQCRDDYLRGCPILSEWGAAMLARRDISG